MKKSEHTGGGRAAAIDHWATALEHTMGGLKAALATVICHLVSSLIHKSGTLVRHARRVVGDLRADL